MKKLLLTLFVVFFVVFGNAQKLRNDVEISRPAKSSTSIKYDTTYYLIDPIIEASLCAQNTTLGKSGFYTYLGGDAGKKVLSFCLSKMNIDTLNCDIITDDSFFHTLKKDEFSSLYIKTTKINGEYEQNKPPYYQDQKNANTEKKPKVFIEYFSDIKNSEYLDFRVFVKR